MSWSCKAGASPTPSARSVSPRWLRDELLDGEIFYSLREAEVVIESWRRHYNTVRPHASLGYRAPAPEVIVPAFASSQPVSPPIPAMASRPLVH
jgi:putative transposase